MIDTLSSSSAVMNSSILLGPDAPLKCAGESDARMPF